MKKTLALILLAVFFLGSCRKHDLNSDLSKPENSSTPFIANAALENWFVKNPMGKYLSVDWKKAKQISIGNVAVVTVPITHISLPASASISSTDKKVNDVGSSGNAVLTTFDPYHPPVLYFFQDKTRAKPDSVKGLLMNFAPDDPKKEDGAKKLWTGTLSEWNMQGDSIFCQHLTKSMVTKKYLVNLDADAQGTNAAKLITNSSLKVSKSVWGIIVDAVKTIIEAIGWVFQVPGQYNFVSNDDLHWCDFLWGLFGGCNGDGGGGGGGGSAGDIGTGVTPPSSYDVIFSAFIPGYDGFPGTGDWTTYYADGGGWSNSPSNPCNTAIGGGQAIQQVDPGSGCGGTQISVTTAMIINYTAVKYKLTADQQYWLNNNTDAYFSLTNYINSTDGLYNYYFGAVDFLNFSIAYLQNNTNVSITDFMAEIAPMINAVPINDGKSAIDVSKYINCFTDGKTASSYTLTIYVAQPKPGHNDQWSSSVVGVSQIGTLFVNPGGQVMDVGHTFVGFTKNNTDGTAVTQVMGFYPNGASTNTKGVVKDDSNHPYNVSMTVNVTPVQFNSALTTTLNDSASAMYVLANQSQVLAEYNCTDAAKTWLRSANVYTPSLSRGMFDNTPGDFGQALTQVTGASNAAGQAPIGHGPCN